MFSIFTKINKKAFRNAVIATLTVIVITVIGFMNLQNYDAVLMIYFFGIISMTFGIAYKHSVWLQCPPTQKYWKCTWQLLRSKDYWTQLKDYDRLTFKNLLLQESLMPRSKMCWSGHFLPSVGCLISSAVAFGLTFGWMHFTLVPDTTDMYETHSIGFSIMTLKLGIIIALFLFHVLVWTAIMVIVGSAIMMHRRFVDEGQMASQWSERDWLPPILLVVISVTGLGIWFDYSFLEGKISQFIAITHTVVVAMFLMWIPFSKSFHIFQRPVQIGANIYRLKGAKEGMQVCPHTKEEYTCRMQINDLKEVTKELGFKLENKEGMSYLEYSPKGKRCILAKTHLKAREGAGSFFG